MDNKQGGIGFVGILTIAFIILKLCGVITWSWYWVLSPIWITAILSVTILVFICILAGIKEQKKKKF